jgi:D-arabinose 1-dehydrogenase-like Zn-dependent alcohol dehydrogenase
MFLNANTGAKASQEMTARFVAAKAAKARAKAIVNGEQVAVELIPSKKPARKSIKKLENGTESTWLSERHEKLRTDSIQNIQNAISKQEELKGSVSTKLERLLEIAHARLLCSNERGM